MVQRSIMRMRWSGSISLVASLLLACSTHAPVKVNWCPAGTGTISGYVRYEDDLPTPHTVATQDPVCSKSLELVKVRDKRLANVVVYLEGAGGCNAVQLPEMLIEVRGCLLQPSVIALRSGQNLRVVNRDSSMHAFKFEFEDLESSLYVLKEGQEFLWKLDRQAIGYLVCTVHPWSRAMIGVFDHPFYAVTDDRGVYELRGLQSGNYTLKAVHQRLGVATARVELKDAVRHIFEDAEFEEQW